MRSLWGRKLRKALQEIPHIPGGEPRKTQHWRGLVVPLSGLARVPATVSLPDASKAPVLGSQHGVSFSAEPGHAKNNLPASPLSLGHPEFHAPRHFRVSTRDPAILNVATVDRLSPVSTPSAPRRPQGGHGTKRKVTCGEAPGRMGRAEAWTRMRQESR